MPRSTQPVALKVSAAATTSTSRAGSEYPPALPPAPPSEAVAQLRRDYRWAAISQFLFTFGEAFGLVDWDIEVRGRWTSQDKGPGRRSRCLHVR